jgi:hypothetical protein
LARTREEVPKHHLMITKHSPLITLDDGLEHHLQFEIEDNNVFWVIRRFV